MHGHGRSRRIHRERPREVLKINPIKPLDLWRYLGNKSAAMFRILIVEDNEMSRDMLSRRLSRHGYDVILALDGKSAIDAAHSILPDLILMDLRLPDMNGKEVTRLLKSDPATAHIPILALTAHAMESDRADALRIGCDDFETKPIDLPRLLGKISTLLHKLIPPQDPPHGLQFPSK